MDTGTVRIVVENLACRRSERLIFADLSFTVDRGEMLVVTGRNGAGKSSLIAMLAGRLRPERGSARLEGAGDTPLPEVINLVGHRDALKSALTASENLAFARALLGRPGLEPDEALGRVGLAHAAGLPVAYLSAGQRRRVALARLLVSERPIWLLDEPTSALDVASQAMLAALMRDHLTAGGLIVAATHMDLGIAGTRELRIERPAVADLGAAA